MKNKTEAEDDVSDDENLDSGLSVDEEDEEEERRDIDEPDLDEELIEYDKWEGRLARLADGTEKKKYDFFTVRVPLRDFWDDFSIFLRHLYCIMTLTKIARKRGICFPKIFGMEKLSVSLMQLRHINTNGVGSISPLTFSNCHHISGSLFFTYMSRTSAT